MDTLETTLSVSANAAETSSALVFPAPLVALVARVVARPDASPDDVDVDVDVDVVLVVVSPPPSIRSASVVRRPSDAFVGPSSGRDAPRHKFDCTRGVTRVGRVMGFGFEDHAFIHSHSFME